MVPSSWSRSAAMGGWSAVVPRVRGRHAVHRPVPQHPAALLVQRVHLGLLVLTEVVIVVAQLGLAGHGRRGEVERGGELPVALVLVLHRLAHGVGLALGVATVPEAFQPFGEQIPIVPEEAHHARVGHDGGAAAVQRSFRSRTGKMCSHRGGCPQSR